MNRAASLNVTCVLQTEVAVSVSMFEYVFGVFMGDYQFGGFSMSIDIYT